MSSTRAQFKKFTLKFVDPMGTSRGALFERDTFILLLRRDELTGLGECAPLPGLSIDHRADFPDKLESVCEMLNRGMDPGALDLADWPAIRFGLESALLDLERGGRRVWFESSFVRGDTTIPINGLVVMSDAENMLRQALAKVEQGFDCIKIKVGALDFETECALLAELRGRFSADRIQLRLDANGAFAPADALAKLERLSRFDIHSIEQPIKPGQRAVMAELCRRSPIPIALDEELIGLWTVEDKAELLDEVKPRHTILKPTLVGGIDASQEWISLASERGISYWITSALESNIGLNIISQWTATLAPELHQGLGTGRLYERNFASPLYIETGELGYSRDCRPDEVNHVSDLVLM